MLTDPGRIVADVLLTERGVDSGKSPTLINPNQLSFAVNATVRAGFLRQRPVWQKVSVSYLDTSGNPFDPTGGLYQTASYFDPAHDINNPDQPKIVVSISGRLYSIDMGTLVGKDITPDSTSSADRPQVWMLQAQQFLVVQDNWTRPLAYDGSRCWRLPLGNGLPIGQMMEYSQGRIWVAQGNQYTAGDIIYGPSGTAPYNKGDSILYNTENQFLNEGGSFPIPFSNEVITAMKSLPTMDTSLGQGPLMIFTNNFAFSNVAPTDRADWKNFNYPLQVVAQQNYGAISSLGNTTVNGDIFYRSKDGIRSLRIAQRRFVDAWGNLPMSREVKRALLYDDQRLLPYASSTLFDNRLLVTCAPGFYPGQGVFFSGLAVLDYDILSAMDQLFNPANRVPPAYDGLWTGLRILQIFSTTNRNPDRCFAFVLGNTSNKIELWELMIDNDRAIVQDSSTLLYQDNQTQSVVWSFETKSFDFGDGAALKRLKQLEMWLDQIIGTVELQWYFRPDQDPNWHVWGEKQYCTPQSVCPPLAECYTPAPEFPGYQPRKRLPEPVPNCDSSVKKMTNLGYEFQFRCVVTGACRLKKIRFSAQTREDDPHAGCDDLVAVCYPNPGCMVNDFTYVIP